MGVRIRSVTLLCVLSIGVGVCAAAPTERELIRTALAASGEADPIEITLAQLAIEHELARIEHKLGGGRPTVHRAHRLHEMLQKRYLRQYEATADGLTAILERGSYNCLSATLLYGLAARRLGFEALVLERPSHLRLRLRAGARTVDVETTQRYGFDRGSARLAPQGSGVEETRTGGIGPSRAAPPAAAYREVPLEAAVVFAWLNRAWRELETGQATAAAEHAHRAAVYLAATSGSEAEELQRLFARAFRTQYEVGRFDDALAIARLDTEVFPGITTSRDRLLAAAAKVIEEASDDDDPARAETILDDVARRLDGTRDAERIVRQLAPLVAAAAVRGGEFERAARLAARYAEAEPDPIEGARLVDWVEARSSGALLAAP